jgi:hypothetical protein
MIRKFRSESLSAADFDPASWIEEHMRGGAVINSITTSPHKDTETNRPCWITTIEYDDPNPPVHFHINIDMDYQLNDADVVMIDILLKNEAANFLSMAKRDIEEWATGPVHVKSSSTATCAIPRSDI